MGDFLVPKQDTKKRHEQPLSEKWGLSLACGPSIMLDTSVSEGGFGARCSAQAEIADNFNDKYTFGLSYSFASTDGKILASQTAPSSTTINKHQGIQAFFGKSKRSFPLYNKKNELIASFNTISKPMIGIGWMSVDGGDQTFMQGTSEEETLSLGSKKSKTFMIGSETGARGEFRPFGRGPTFGIGPSLYYGVQYAGEGSDLNRIGLELMFMVDIGWGDTATKAGGNADTELGGMGIAQGLFTFGHKLTSRYYMNAALLGPMEDVDDYGPFFDEQKSTDSNSKQDTPADEQKSASRDSMQNTPVVEAAPSFMSGMSNDLETPLRGGEIWYWIFGGTELLGGIGFLAGSKGDEGKIGGFSDILSVLRLLGYFIANIHTPKKRLSLADSKVEAREIYVDLATFGANTLIAAIGGAAENDVIAKSGTRANIKYRSIPQPLGQKHGRAKRLRVWLLVHQRRQEWIEIEFRIP